MIIALWVAVGPLRGQTVTTTVGAGSEPWAVAVNPVTNKIYVANYGSGNVTVIDGATNPITTVGAGSYPWAVAVNPLTNKIYVANCGQGCGGSGNGNVTVIDGATNSTTTVTDPKAYWPQAVAVNPLTNKIYVANQHSSNVTVIDGATNSTTTVSADSSPRAVAVNPVTNKIYVANAGGTTVTVIDGATNSTTTVRAGIGPCAVAVNPVTNKIYVANLYSNNVTVIDGATNSTTTVMDWNAMYPAAVAVNPVTNKIYVANQWTDNVTVIDGPTYMTTTVTSPNATWPQAVAVNPVTNKIYVANYDSWNVTVIDGATNSTTTVADPTAVDPVAVAVNPATNKIYVANHGSSTVTVIDGTTNSTATVGAGSEPWAVAVNPVTNQIYVANAASSNITVIDGATNSATTATDPTASSPVAVAVNPVTNKIYVANDVSNTVTVIDGATKATTPVSVGAFPVGLAVNPVTNKIYVANASGNTVTVIDGATKATTPVSAGSQPRAVAVNPSTNKIYVANCGQGCGGSGNGNVTVIDGATNSTTPVTDPNASTPYAVAVNPLTNQIYVANCGQGCGGSGNGNVTVIDGATSLTTTVTDPNAISPHALAVNPATNKIYVANSSSGNATVIDGATKSTTTVSAGSGPWAVAVNPVTNKIYVANAGSSNLTVIDEQQVQPIPLEASIMPLADNMTGSLTPAFNFVAMSGFVPFALAPDNLLFEVDTWQGPWTAATALGNGFFNATTAALQSGVHILYAYSSDGQDATSTMGSSGNGTGTSPLISDITAYVFLISPPNAALSASSLGFGNQVINTTSVSQTVALTNNGAGPLAIAGIAASGDYSAFDNCPPELDAGASCTIELGFTPTILGADNGTLTLTDNNLGVAGTTQTVSLTGTGVLASPTAALSPATLSFANQLVGTQSGSQPVTLANSGGQALSISPILASLDFSQTNNCGSSLAAGSSCTINVFFSPTTTGTISGTVTVADNAAGSPQSVSLSGVGLTTVTVTPTSLPFGNQGISSTSAAKTLTVKNTGSGALTFSSITISGANAGDFAQTNNCPAGILPGAKCTFSVTFTPSLLAAESATLTLSDYALTSPQTVALSGTGVADATLTPSSANFGNVAINTASNAKSFTLRNNQSLALTISGITVSNPDFTEADTCGGSLAAHTSCTISVTLTPSVLGAETGSLTVSDNAAPPYNSLTSSLSGTGVADVTLTPASHNFGNVAINTASNAQTFTLRNNELATLSIPAITVTSSNASDFAPTGGTCGSAPTSLGPQTSCTIIVTLTPTVLGAETGSLTVSYAASAPYSTLSSSLSGTGVADVTLTPAAHNFGNVAIDTASNAATFTLRNNQLTTLSIPAVTVTSSNASDFAPTGGSCGAAPTSLGPQTSCTISVTLTPTVLGGETGSLAVTDSGAAPYNSLSATLSGTGVADVTLTPASHNFGNVAINTASNAETFTLRNNELATLSIAAITVTSSNASDFAPTGGSCGAAPTSLGPQSSCTIIVTLTPTVLGGETGSLTVTDSAAAPYNSLSSSLSGTGVAQAAVSPTSLTFAKQTVGTSSAAKNVTLRNNLLSALTVSSITFTGADPGDFAETDTCDGSVSAQSTCTISVTFTPTATGTRTATLNVRDTANNSPQQVSVTGTGK